MSKELHSLRELPKEITELPKDEKDADAETKKTKTDAEAEMSEEDKITHFYAAKLKEEFIKAITADAEKAKAGAEAKMTKADAKARMTDEEFKKKFEDLFYELTH